jgi:hypothetical protein
VSEPLLKPVDYRVLAWFSCGAASAVALKLAVEKYRPRVEPVYCEIDQEHPDNQRFLADVEQWLGVTVKRLRSEKYGSDIFTVFEREKYIAGIKGARCTRSLKQDVRKAYQLPTDTHVFGYTADETERVAKFEKNNPALFCDWLLVDHGITKRDCYRIIKDAGIELPAMYRLGYKNNNCIGCVKGGAGYWNKIRKDFPEAFDKMAAASRRLGVRLIRLSGERMFLDELPVGAGRMEEEPDIDCGPQCVMPDLFEWGMEQCTT